ncbi:MAG: Bax inhibitor-1/YccA family protein [Deltaproteobacteria bacterium]|nr:Bax inhibitor-1/YccA family protein [Deltaproteobacteria bacterium]
MKDFQVTMRPAYAVSDAQSALVRSVFGWMTAGLFLSGIVAMYVLNTPAVTQSILGKPGLFLILAFAEVGLVVWLSARVMKMSAVKATSVFLIYSALNGVTLAPLAFIYTRESLASTFMITSAVFGSMAVFGYVTRRDLSSLGSFLYMGLWGIIIASLVNMFLQSTAVGFVMSVAGVIVFTGLTAWDVNKIKNMSTYVEEGTDDFRRYAILGALSLYLDFINLFIMLLRFFGSHRD